MEKRTITDFIVVHHSASPRDTTTFEDIRRWHVGGNGWDSVGYHRVIEADGSIHTGMPINMVGYHTKYDGFNYKSVAVCLTGNFMEEKPTGSQLNSLEEVLDEWREKYNIPRKNILGHRETGSATACPGDNLVNWLKKYRAGEGGSEYLALNEDIPTRIEDKYSLKKLDWYSKYWTGNEFIQGTLDYVEKQEEKITELENQLGDYPEENEGLIRRIETLLEDKNRLEDNLTASRGREETVIKTLNKIEEEYGIYQENCIEEVRNLKKQIEKQQKDFTEFRFNIQEQYKLYEEEIEKWKIKYKKLKEKEVGNMNKNDLWEAIKEPLRLMVLSIIPLLLSYFAGLSYEWAGSMILVLRFIDKYLHNLAPEGKAGGLTRF